MAITSTNAFWRAPRFPSTASAFYLVTNYRFTDGPLNGINIGGGYRWQDKVILGYEPKYTDDQPKPRSPTISAIPITGRASIIPSSGSATTSVSGATSTGTPRINVRNVSADQDLIPINTQPDGSIGAGGSGSTRECTLTTTFTF